MGSGATILDINTPGLQDLLADGGSMNMWDSLRTRERGIDVSKAAQDNGVSPQVAHKQLEKLHSVGLVEKLPAKPPRTQVLYRSTVSRLIITFNPGDPSAEACMQQVMGLSTMLPVPAKGQATSVPEPLLAAIQQWSVLTVSAMPMNERQLRKLQEMLQGIEDFLTALDGARPRGTDGRGIEPHFRISMRLQPVPTRSAPSTLPPVRFVPTGSSLLTAEPAPTSGKGALSARERQVALLIAEGHTQEEAAKLLGVARSTIATLSRRVYRKLGATRRVELMSLIKQLG